MRLQTKRTVTENRILVSGSLEKQVSDETLVSMLSTIRDRGLAGLKVEDPFIKGIVSYLDSNGYIRGNELTPAAEQVIKTKKVWKGFEGRFVITVLSCDDNHYLLDCQNMEEVKIGMTTEMECPDLLDEYLIGDSLMRSFRFNRYTSKLLESKTQELNLSYEFSNDSITYSYKGRVFHSTENFRLQTRSKALQMANSLLTKYKGLDNKDGVVIFNGGKNPETTAFVEGILYKKNGIFDIKDEDSSLSDIMITIKDQNVSKALFKSYLMLRSKFEYITPESITDKFYEFASLFEEVQPLDEENDVLFDKLLSDCQSGTVPYFRMNAYIDLHPGNRIAIKTKSFTNKSLSMEKLVKELMPSGSLDSVKFVSKFAKVNAKICRNTELFAEVLTAKYKVKPEVYISNLSRNTSVEQKKAFDMLCSSDSMQTHLLDEDVMEEIHDRYFRVVSGGQESWFVLSAELDKLIYDDDQVETNTTGTVRELTMASISRDDVPKPVLELMGVTS